MKPRISVQWAASITSVFWGVWWTSFIKDIAASNINAITVLGLNVAKTLVLIGLVIWGVIFTIVFVRWLARAQYWGWETGIGYWISNSLSMAIVIGTLIFGLIFLPKNFLLDQNLVAYGFAISLLWPFAPFVVAIWPEERR
jgi:hypothetical protein